VPEVPAGGRTNAMLARYRIVRGKRDPGDPLPLGARIDTRKHTRHFLRPDAASVKALHDAPTPASFRRFASEYRRLLAARFAADRAPFDALAERAQHEDVFLGCSCPTSWNPDVRRCHTALALAFMKKKYPRLRVKEPRGD
jgi:hypothetical protein